MKDINCEGCNMEYNEVSVCYICKSKDLIVNCPCTICLIKNMCYISCKPFAKFKSGGKIGQ